MKKYFMLVLGAFFCASYGAAETIDTVTFNPARLGQYETLKVTDSLKAHGGINTQALTVQSAGTVNIRSNGGYYMGNMNVQGSLSMPSTHFTAAKLYSSGTAQFVNTASNSSIATLDGGDALRVRANILQLANLAVTGGETLNYAGESVNGLILGGNPIPPPSSTCSNLGWVSIQAEEGGTAGTYKVLGFGTCQDDCVNSCGAWTGSYSSLTKPMDTCDLDTVNEFDCSTVSKKTTCRDVRKVDNSSQATTTVSSAKLIEVSGSVTDTCDGNTKSYYTCDGTEERTCTDVYTAAGGSHLCKTSGIANGCFSSASYPSSCGYLTGSENIQGCRLTGGVGTLSEKIDAAGGIDAFCEQYVAPSHNSPCYGTLSLGKCNLSDTQLPGSNFNPTGGILGVTVEGGDSTQKYEHYWNNGYYVGGKSGTAQKVDPNTGAYSDELTTGTYIGFGGDKTKTPKYAIMVRVDDAHNGGYSGSAAAQPIFDSMSNFMIQYEGVSK